MKWLEDVSLSNRHNNGQDSYKACEKKEDSERPDWAWPCPRLRDRNKQSNKDKHRPACKAAPQRLFSCSTGPVSFPTQRSSAEWRSWLHLAPFKLSHEIKKMQVKSHSAVKQQEHFLATGKMTPFTVRLCRSKTTEIWEERWQQHFVLQGCSKHSNDEKESSVWKKLPFPC